MVIESILEGIFWRENAVFATFRGLFGEALHQRVLDFEASIWTPLWASFLAGKAALLK